MSVLTTTVSYIKSAKIFPGSVGVYYGIISKWEVHLSNCIKIYTVTLIKGSKYSQNFKKDYYCQVDDRSIRSMKRDTRVEWERDFTCISFHADNFQEFKFALEEPDKKYENEIFNLELKNTKIQKIFERILEDCLTNFIRQNTSLLSETAILLSGTTRRFW